MGGGVHLGKRTGIASMVTDASIWRQMQVGGGSTRKFSSGCFYFLREVGSETTSRGRRNQGAGSWEEKGAKITTRRLRVHNTAEKQKHECSTQRVLEGMKLSDTRQPRYVLFSATFSCLGVGCRTYHGGVLPDEYDGTEGPGSWELV